MSGTDQTLFGVAMAMGFLAFCGRSVSAVAGGRRDAKPGACQLPSNQAGHGDGRIDWI